MASLDGGEGWGIEESRVELAENQLHDKMDGNGYSPDDRTSNTIIHGLL